MEVIKNESKVYVYSDKNNSYVIFKVDKDFDCTSLDIISADIIDKIGSRLKLIGGGTIDDIDTYELVRSSVDALNLDDRRKATIVNSYLILFQGNVQAYNLHVSMPRKNRLDIYEDETVICQISLKDKSNYYLFTAFIATIVIIIFVYYYFKLNNEFSFTPVVSNVITSDSIADRSKKESITDDNDVDIEETISYIPSNFVLVPKGTLARYQMWSSKKEDYISIDVAVDSFYISKYEVIQFDYEQLTNENPSTFKGDSFPVHNITIYQAVKYCNQLSLKDGYDGFYKIDGTKVYYLPEGNGYRLPTNKEWIYAARNGEKRTTKYAAGDDIRKIAWYGGNSGNKPHKVGTKEPNGRGLFDMNGNVSEFVLWEDGYVWGKGGNYNYYIGFEEEGGMCGGGKLNYNRDADEEAGVRLVLIPRKGNNADLMVSNEPSVININSTKQDNNKDKSNDVRPDVINRKQGNNLTKNKDVDTKYDEAYKRGCQAYTRYFQNGRKETDRIEAFNFLSEAYKHKKSSQISSMIKAVSK